MTAEEVKALQVGETVTIRKEGHEPILCTVAFRGSPANLMHGGKGLVLCPLIKEKSWFLSTRLSNVNPRGGVEMAKNREGRPEWFKFWRRNRRQLDIEELSMESRGVVLTNVMRYFDGTDDLLSMSAIEAMAFNVIKINIDDSFTEYEEMQARNSENGKKGGRPPKTGANRENPVGFSETQASRIQNTEVRKDSSVRSYSTEDMVEYPPGTGFYRPRSEVREHE